MYSSLQAILSEDKKLTVTSAPPVSEGENNSVSVTVSLPSDTDFTDTEIYLEFLCASGERFITPNLNPSLSASPVVSYLLKSGALSSSGRCYIQITLVKGDVISKSVLDENSSFWYSPLSTLRSPTTKSLPSSPHTLPLSSPCLRASTPLCSLSAKPKHNSKPTRNRSLISSPPPKTVSLTAQKAIRATRATTAKTSVWINGFLPLPK